MQLPREMIVEHLRAGGEFEASERAARELPEKVDTERESELLVQFGIDPQRMADDFGGQAPAVG
jgi:hypothetical protein